MRNEIDDESEAPDREPSAPVAGYAPDPKAAADPRSKNSKFGRHNTRVLPTPIALRSEYRKLANDPKCGKRGAIPALAKKYKASQSAIRKALEKKEKKVRA